MKKLLTIFMITISSYYSCFPTKRSTSVECSPIQLPVAQVLKQRFIDNKLENIISGTNIIEELADKTFYPFTISETIMRQMFNNQKTIKDLTLEESVGVITKLVLRDLSIHTTNKLHALGIIPGIRKSNRIKRKHIHCSCCKV